MRDRLEGNLRQSEVYHSLQEDISQFRRDLTSLLANTETIPHQPMGLEAKLHTFKVIFD
jgi:hypothetical protein